MTESYKIRFKPPRDIPQIRPGIHVPLLQNSKRWLALLNKQTHQSDWRVEPVSSSRELLQAINENRFLFSIIEIDMDSIAEQLRLVRKIVREINGRYECQQALAIVGRGEFSHDISSDPVRSGSLEFSLELAFRAAGAVHCCWHAARINRLIQLIDRFAQSLPANPVKIEEYIFRNLPWPGFTTFEPKVFKKN